MREYLIPASGKYAVIGFGGQLMVGRIKRLRWCTLEFVVPVKGLRKVLLSKVLWIDSRTGCLEWVHENGDEWVREYGVEVGQ